MGRYQRHVFVCINERPKGHPKGCCSEKGSAEVREALKGELRRRGLAAIVRANKSGCLDGCEFGITMVIYPDGIWYGRVKKEDIPEIVDRTIINGEVIQRLLIGERRYAPDSLQYFKLDVPPGIP